MMEDVIFRSNDPVKLSDCVSVSGTTNKEEEETAVTPVTEGNAVLLGTRIRTESDLGGSIDLLAALQLHNTTRQGVSQVPGLVRLKPAYYLQGESTLSGIFDPLA